MENTQPNPNVPKRNLKPYLLVGVFVFVALLSLYFAYRAFLKTKTTPPEFRKVSAVVGTDITVTIKTDGGGMFFEHNGQRLSPTNRITDLMPGTEYTLTIVNDSQVKQGVFIPALGESIAVDPTQSAKISMTFTNPGTYYFLGNVFQPDWDGLKSGFDVGMDTIETPPIIAGAGTNTPTPSSTTVPTPTSGSGSFTSCTDVTEIPQSECQALVDLYNSTNGPEWTPKPGWLQTLTPCGWYGVECGPAPRHVVSLVLDESSMDGVIPQNIGNLTGLQNLFLGNNRLTGSIPSSIGNLENLRNLSLEFNSLTGNIPVELGNLTQLATLHLRNNQLTGVVPASLAKLTAISNMNVTLVYNSFSGIENQTICPWLTAHTASTWWQIQSPPIATDPCTGTDAEKAQPVAARSLDIGKPTTMPVAKQNILGRIVYFFQQLLKNTFGGK